MLMFIHSEQKLSTIGEFFWVGSDAAVVKHLTEVFLAIAPIGEFLETWDVQKLSAVWSLASHRVLLASGI